jgi:hypothetical protein
MKKFVIVIAPLLVTACTAAQAIELLPPDAPALTPVEQQAPTLPPAPAEREYADLPDLGQAPELENQVWLNTNQALRLENLRGKVVLLDMWTFG